MELTTRYYDPQQYIETANANKVSRVALLCGSQNIKLQGKSILVGECVLRGDLANIKLGRHCIVDDGALLKPAYRKASTNLFTPLTIGDCVYIGERAVVMATAVGAHVHIGADAVVGRRCVLGDSCYIDSGAVVPADTTVAPFALMRGNPARQVGRVPHCAQELQRQSVEAFYDSFRRMDDKKFMPEWAP